MKILKISIIILSLFCLFSCSTTYKKLTKNSIIPENNFSKHLLDAYREKADFEAKEMHDKNSAKLYSEKALKAIEGKKILPQKIEYWQIAPDKKSNLIKGYDNLMIIYEEAMSLDPFNLAKAISSLDCWAEQQEEDWQTWDINRCRDDFLNAMHQIYNIIELKNNQLESKKSKPSIIINQEAENNDTRSSQNKKESTLQIIYFDFDKYKLSSISIEKIKYFINENKKSNMRYLIIGHTDTVGTKEYNTKLSLLRAKAVKKILVNMGISSEKIKIIGKGENELSIKTKDDIAHPANRRAEISPLN